MLLTSPSVIDSIAIGEGYRALVVDDDRCDLSLCTALLENMGFQVTGVQSVAAAEKALGIGAFDLVIANESLPDGNAMQVGRILRQHREDAALMLMTASPSMESAMEALHLGVDDFLEKPLADLGFIMQRVGRAMGAVRLKRENADLLAQLMLRTTELEQAAARDSLTRLYNHAFFQESLRREVQRSSRNHGEFGLLFIDFDNFKAVNHTRGHPSGDALLKAFADMLQGGSRAADLHFRLSDHDLAARYGG